MTRRTFIPILTASAALAVAALTIQPLMAQTNGDKLYITAFAVNMSNIGTGQTATVDFNVDRWTTEADRTRLINTMLDKGQDALLKELQSMRSHGRLRFPGLTGRDPLNLRLGWDLKYAWQTPLPDGGRRIVLATDRVMSFWEVRNRPRSVDYPFTVVEIHVDRNGEGEGKLSTLTKIHFDKKKNVIELETYASEPVRLQNVKVKTTT